MLTFLSRRAREFQTLLQTQSVGRFSQFNMDEMTEPPAKRAHLEEVQEKEDHGLEKDQKHGRDNLPPRRKCILLISFSGKGYHGMQKNPGVPTIEEDLLEALNKAQAIPERLKDNLGQLQFQRSARTDKGVSAARQASLLPLINTHLPDQIRVQALKRVTKSFDSRHHCSGRTYEYLIPTYAFAPFYLTKLEYRVDEETVSRVNRLLGEYVGTHNYHNFTSGKKFEEMSCNRYIISFQSDQPFVSRANCSECDKEKEVEFVSLKVRGQSFLLHQIRKMIGLVIGIIRGHTPESTLREAFEREKVDIPKAPALGLLLENVHFDQYNSRVCGDGVHELLEWTDYTDEVESFKKKYIFQTIIDTEIEELSMMQWLNSLKIHNFCETAKRLREQAAKEKAELTTKTDDIAGVSVNTSDHNVDSIDHNATQTDTSKHAVDPTDTSSQIIDNKRESDTTVEHKQSTDDANTVDANTVDTNTIIESSVIT